MSTDGYAVLPGTLSHSHAVQHHTTPIYRYVLTWIVLLPVLYFATNSAPSILSHNNSEFMTTNASLVQTHSGMRPQVLIQYGFMFTLMLAGRVEILRAVRLNKFVVLSGIVLAATSALWSVSPVMSLRTAIDLALTTGLACYLSERFSTDNLMRLVVFAGCIAAVLSIFLALAVPSYGIFQRYSGGAWQGIFSHKNGLGLGMTALLTPIFFLRKSTISKLIYSGALLSLVVLSRSRSAWFVAIELLLFVGWLELSKRLRRSEFLVVTFAATALAMVAVVVAVTHLAAFMIAIGKDPTLTGRTEIYRFVGEAILKHPVNGYGYGAFWLPINPESQSIATRINWPSIGYAENGLLDLALQLGLGGVAIAMYIMGRAIFQGLSVLTSDYYRPATGWFLSLVVLELLTNVDAGWVLAPGNLMWTLTLVGVLGLAKEARHVQALKASGRIAAWPAGKQPLQTR